MKITLTLKDSVVRDFARHHRYQSELKTEDGGQVVNPQTPEAYVEDCIKQFIKLSVKSQRVADAQAQAMAAEQARPDTDLTF